MALQIWRYWPPVVSIGAQGWKNAERNSPVHQGKNSKVTTHLSQQSEAA